MVTAHNITSKQDIVKPLQYVGEGDTVTTATNFGTTPSSSSFTLVGNNTQISINRDISHLDQAVLGNEDLIDAIKEQSIYSFTLQNNPINLNLWKFLWNAIGGGTDSPDESLSFTYSYNLDGTEYYVHLRGCRPTSGTLSVARGTWTQNMSFICKDITIPNTTDGNGGTPTYQSSETTTQAISHEDGGGNPFTWNSTTFGERSFSTTVTRNMAITAVNGETDILYCKPSDRSITFAADVFAGTTSSETVFENDYEGKTARAMSYKFNSSGPVTLTYSNCVLTGVVDTFDAANPDAMIQSITGRAESVTDL